MPAKKKPATRAATVKPQSILDKHGSAFKMFANYGFAGTAFAYILMVSLPEAQKSFTEAIKQQVEHSDAQRQLALEHGERAVEKISSAVDRLGEKFGAVQATTQQNQNRLIDEQRKTNELLSGQQRAFPANPFHIGEK